MKTIDILVDVVLVPLLFTFCTVRLWDLCFHQQNWTCSKCKTSCHSYHKIVLENELFQTYLTIHSRLFKAISFKACSGNYVISHLHGNLANFMQLISNNIQLAYNSSFLHNFSFGDFYFISSPCSYFNQSHFSNFYS